MTADVQRWLALVVVLGAGAYIAWRGWRAWHVARAARAGCGRGPGCGCG